jgi:hypothetical protein
VKIKAFNALNNPFFLASLGLHEFNQLAQTYETIHHDRQQEEGQQFTNAALQQGKPVTEMPGGAFRQFFSKHLPNGWVDPNVEATPGDLAQENMALRRQDESNVKDSMGLGKLRSEVGYSGMQADPNSSLGRIEARTGFVNPEQTPGEVKQQQTVDRQNRQDTALQNYRQQTTQDREQKMAIDVGHFKVDEGLRRKSLDISAARESREAKAQNESDAMLAAVVGDPALPDHIDNLLPDTKPMNGTATKTTSDKTIANLKWGTSKDPAEQRVRQVLANNPGLKQFLGKHPEYLMGGSKALATGMNLYNKQVAEYQKTIEPLNMLTDQIKDAQDFMRAKGIVGGGTFGMIKNKYRAVAAADDLPNTAVQQQFAQKIAAINQTASTAFAGKSVWGTKIAGELGGPDILPKVGGDPDAIAQKLTGLYAYATQLRAAKTPNDLEDAVDGISPYDEMKHELAH